jgi:hypothetical protein
MQLKDHKIEWEGIIDAEGNQHTKSINIKKDGDKYCATYDDFVNLQESPAGFGSTVTQAMVNLFHDNARIAYKEPPFTNLKKNW